MVKTNNLSLRYINVREEDRWGISMTDVTEIIQVDTDQIAEIEESHSVTEYNVDKITQIGKGMDRTIGMYFRKSNFRGNLRPNQMYRGRYRRNYRKENYERGRSRSREGQYPGNARRNVRSSSSRS